MVRFMWAVRTAFNDKKKRWIFVGVLAFSSVMMYYLPNALIPSATSSPVIGFFGSLLSYGDMLQYVDSGDISKSSLIFFDFFPLALFVVALGGVFFSHKIKPLFACAVPLGIYAAVTAIDNFHLNDETPACLAYATLYIIFALLVILFVVFLLLSLYLPLKEPAPRPERPKRERKPTKDERIAELERQVAALRGKEKDET